MLNSLSDSHVLLGEYDAALGALSRAEAILRSLPPPDAADITEIRMLPGQTYHRMARVHALLAKQRTSPPQVRSSHARQAREWSHRASAVLEPLKEDVLIGAQARRLLEELREIGAEA